MITQTLSIVWNFDPVLFSIGSLDVRYYGLMWALAILIGAKFFDNFVRREGLPKSISESIFLYGTLATILGARLGHCLFYDPMEYLRAPWTIITGFRDGGMASHGAAVGLLIGLWLFSRRNKLPYIWSLDRIMIPVGIGGAIVRLGNLFNSEIFGQATTMPWGFEFIRSHKWATEFAPAAVHPTQIYEALCYLATFGILVWLYYAKDVARRRPGILFGIGLIGTFLTRFFIEFIKTEQEPFELGMTLDMGQWLSIPFIVLGAVMIYRGFKRPLQAVGAVKNALAAATKVDQGDYRSGYSRSDRRGGPNSRGRRSQSGNAPQGRGQQGGSQSGSRGGGNSKQQGRGSSDKAPADGSQQTGKENNNAPAGRNQSANSRTERTRQDRAQTGGSQSENSAQDEPRTEGDRQGGTRSGNSRRRRGRSGRAKSEQTTTEGSPQAGSAQAGASQGNAQPSRTNDGPRSNSRQDKSQAERAAGGGSRQDKSQAERAAGGGSRQDKSQAERAAADDSRQEGAQQAEPRMEGDRQGGTRSGNSRRRRGRSGRAPGDNAAQGGSQSANAAQGDAPQAGSQSGNAAQDNSQRDNTRSNRRQSPNAGDGQPQAGPTKNNE